MRIPLPPPPAVAFIMTGNPISLAMFSALVRSFKMPSLPGIIGIPASFAAFLAAALSPILRITSPDGPMNEIPAASTASAKSAFSARKP